MQVRDRDAEGRKVAEWCMKNRKAINLKYVIWGQKIWSPSRDSEKPWTQWRKMEDRGSITANHLCVFLPLDIHKRELLRLTLNSDHVHVSYN